MLPPDPSITPPPTLRTRAQAAVAAVTTSFRTIVRDRKGAKPRDWAIGCGTLLVACCACFFLTPTPDRDERDGRGSQPFMATAGATVQATVGVTEVVEPTATRTERPTATEVQSNTPGPTATARPTPTSLPTTAVPPTVTPAFAYDPPCRDQVNCADFIGRGVDPQTWWSARQSTDCPNPGRLDGDNDGSVCEEGEGGVPAAAPPALPTEVPAPPPAARRSAAPQGRDCPADLPVKGNINREGEKIYHVPGARSYGATVPEECFATAADAEAAGFRPPRN